MKNYTITVNGTAYDVTVEEGGAGETTAAAPKKSVAKAAAPAAAPKPAAPAGGQGAVKVNAPMPGKILSIKVQAGAAVKKGDIIMILEAMKMENEIPAPQDGTIASIDVNAGSAVEAGDVLATLN